LTNQESKRTYIGNLSSTTVYHTGLWKQYPVKTRRRLLRNMWMNSPKIVACTCTAVAQVKQR
jgi:hypothetical protein